MKKKLAKKWKTNPEIETQRTRRTQRKKVERRRVKVEGGKRKSLLVPFLYS